MAEIKSSPGVIVVDTTKLDFFDGYKMQKEAEIYFKENIFNLIIDLNQVTYISSRGLGILIDIHKKCQKNGKLVLCSISKDVISVFKLTALNNVFVIVDSQDEAMSIMKTS